MRAQFPSDWDKYGRGDALRLGASWRRRARRFGGLELVEKRDYALLEPRDCLPQRVALKVWGAAVVVERGAIGVLLVDHEEGRILDRAERLIRQAARLRARRCRKLVQGLCDLVCLDRVRLPSCDHYQRHALLSNRRPCLPRSIVAR